MGAYSQLVEKTKPHRIYGLKAIDADGYQAWYFVNVDPLKERAFLQAIKGKALNFTEFGTIIASGFGDGPDEDTVAELKSAWDYDVKNWNSA